MQFLSDILGAPVDRPKVPETTALGAAWLAGQQAGIYRTRPGSRLIGRWTAASRRNWTARRAKIGTPPGWKA